MSAATSSSGNADWKIDDLINFVKQEIESREICNLVSSNSSDRRKNPVSQSNNYSASAFYSGTRENLVTCVFCRKNHTASRCDVVTDISTRKSILRKRGRCYKCVKCKGRHNVSICEPQPPPQQSVQPSIGNQDSVNPVLTSLVGQSSTFLQTAKAKILNSNVNRSTTIRVLFDGCSQKSFITQEVKNSLKLNIVRNERILLRGFGGGDESPRN